MRSEDDYQTSRAYAWTYVYIYGFLNVHPPIYKKCWASLVCAKVIMCQYQRNVANEEFLSHDILCMYMRNSLKSLEL